MTRPVDISIVVPVYNGSNYLVGCLNSVAHSVEALSPAQRDRVEVVVCDNHSNDETPVIAAAAEFGCASRIVQPSKHQTNRTQNWMHGLAEARGRWLMMLHHDDLMAAGGLAAQLSQIDRPPDDDVVLISGRHRTFEDPANPDRPRPIFLPEGTVDGRLLQRRVLAFFCPFVPFVLFRRDAYEAVGGLDPRWELVQDWELWMRLLNEGDVLFHREEVGWWRRHPTSPAYRNRNAMEHVELAKGLDRTIPVLPSKARRRAVRMALDKAALQLAASPEPDPSWLDDDSLPKASSARLRHERAVRRIGVELAFLRLGGSARLRAKSLAGR